MADLINRAVNILKSPQTEWPVIAAEPTDIATLYKTYIIPLSAIGPVCSWLGSALIGTVTPFGTFRTPLVTGFILLLLSYGLGLVGQFVCALVIEWLAPKFKSVGSRVDALKMVAYSSTAVWVAGVLNLVPLLGLLVILAALYGIYLFYVGLPFVMRTPADQVIPFMIVAALIIFVVMFVIGMIVGAVSGALIVGASLMG